MSSIYVDVNAADAASRNAKYAPVNCLRLDVDYARFVGVFMSVRPAVMHKGYCKSVLIPEGEQLVLRPIGQPRSNDVAGGYVEVIASLEDESSRVRQFICRFCEARGLIPNF